MHGDDPKLPNLRTVVGAWLFCGLLALLALGLTTGLDAGRQPAAESTSFVADRSAAAFMYQPLADRGHPTGAAVARLRRPDMPMQRYERPPG